MTEGQFYRVTRGFRSQAGSYARGDRYVIHDQEEARLLIRHGLIEPEKPAAKGGDADGRGRGRVPPLRGV